MFRRGNGRESENTGELTTLYRRFVLSATPLRERTREKETEGEEKREEGKED